MVVDRFADQVAVELCGDELGDLVNVLFFSGDIPTVRARRFTMRAVHGGWFVMDEPHEGVGVVAGVKPVAG